MGWSVRICKFSCFQETRRCRPLTRTLITSVSSRTAREASVRVRVYTCVRVQSTFHVQTAIRSVGELPASQSTSDSGTTGLQWVETVSVYLPSLQSHGLLRRSSAGRRVAGNWQPSWEQIPSISLSGRWLRHSATSFHPSSVQVMHCLC